MTHFAGKAAKVLFLTGIVTTLLTAHTMAADIAIGAGSTTGSSLRMRAEASTSSDIVTVLDEHVAVAILDDSDPDWFKVAYAGKTGYVSADYLRVDKDNEFETYGIVNGDSVNVRAEATTDSEVLASVSRSTVVTVNGLEDGWYNVTCQYGTEGYIRSDLLDLVEDPEETVIPVSAHGSSIVDFAKQFKGVPYVWGGASPKGFDCSGFTMYVYSQYGYSLPHTATGQWKSGLGTRIYNISELQPGDLVFFCDPSRSNGKACSHVGIYVGGGQHIHSSSSKNKGVVISDLTSGYYNRYFVGGIRA